MPEPRACATTILNVKAKEASFAQLLKVVARLSSPTHLSDGQCGSTAVRDPAELRPMCSSNGGRFATSDLTTCTAR